MNICYLKNVNFKQLIEIDLSCNVLTDIKVLEKIKLKNLKS